MKTYTQEEVDNFIRVTLTETVNGMLDWIKEETEVVRSGSNDVIIDCQLTIKDKGKSMIGKFVYPRLEKHGIIFTT